MVSLDVEGILKVWDVRTFLCCQTLDTGMPDAAAFTATGKVRVHVRVRHCGVWFMGPANIFFIVKLSVIIW
jgi:hypothetical protein